METIRMRTLGVAFATVLFVSPASALDCSLAKSVAEKAICSDSAARTADEALGNAFNQLRVQLPDDERGSLRLSQIAWIRSRDKWCLAPRAIKPLSACLTERTKARQAYLEGKPAAGDLPTGSLRPMFIVRRAAIGFAPLTIEAIKFTGDNVWQSKVNSSIERMVKDAIADSDVRESQGKPAVPDATYFVDLGIVLTYASPRLISLSATYENELGQAHPFRWKRNVNFDIQAGRELKFEDLLNETEAKEIFKYCRSQVAKEKMEGADIHGVDDSLDDVTLEEVAEGTREFSNWQFLELTVEIDYNDNAFGGYGACMCHCTIPYSMLRPLAKKSFPLP